MNSARDNSSAPRLARWGVCIWQSINWKPRWCKRVVRWASATFEVLARRLEHGLGKKHFAQRDTIKAAYQFSFMPDLDGVRMAQAMEFTVGINHIRSNPRARARVLVAGRGAGLHHCGKA